MLHLKKLALATAVGAAALSAPTFADDHAATSITEALQGGDVKLRFRLRYEDVSVDLAGGGDASTNMLSLLTRLTYTSKDLNGWGLGLEMDDVTHVNDYEPEAPAGVGDPEGTEVNQYFLTYKFNKSHIKYGRQRIILDNQRFVGGVGFRQNEQTYDGLSVTYKDVENLSVFAAYISNINRIFGEAATPDVQPVGGRLGDHTHNTALLNLNYKFSPAVSLSGYYYGIDNETFALHSSTTFGLRATGKIEDFGYVAEYASQSDNDENAKDYSASYLNVEGSYNVNSVKFTIGQEIMGADGSNGFFVTPLATLHKFQGWTDLFLGAATGNKDGGIVDTYLNISGKAGPVKLVLAYHMLESDDEAAAGGVSDYGDELGFIIAGKVKGVGLSLKYADFSADDESGLNDVTKLWLTAGKTF